MSYVWSYGYTINLCTNRYSEQFGLIQWVDYWVGMNGPPPRGMFFDPLEKLEKEPEPLGMAQLVLAFALLAVGVVASTMAFFMEKMKFWVSEKKELAWSGSRFSVFKMK